MAKRALGALTGAVLLRDVTEDDLPVFFEQQLDPVATQMAAFPARDRQAFMAHYAKIRSDETVIIQTILFDGRVARVSIGRHRRIVVRLRLAFPLSAVHSFTS